MPDPMQPENEHSQERSFEPVSDADRQVLRDSLRAFFASRWPADSAVERASNVAAVTEIWHGLAAQGLASLGARADQGGLRESLLVFEELGRASCPAPLLGAVVANVALASRPEARGLLDEFHQGKAIPAVAFGAFDGDPAAGSPELRGHSLCGRAAFVEGAVPATHFLVFVEHGIVVVERGAKGLATTEAPGLAVPSLFELSFENTPCTHFDVPADTLIRAAQVAQLACASRALGAAQRAFDLAVEHAKVRKQFGQPIGSFQAMQHKLANGLIKLDGTRLAIEQAARAHDAGRADWPVFAAAALAYANPALREVAIHNHLALGAIGYAEEHEAPRHFRRVHADLVRFGGARRARAALADYLLGPAGQA
jgi:acyl-CoA dehydrogenase